MQMMIMEFLKSGAATQENPPCHSPCDTSQSASLFSTVFDEAQIALPEYVGDQVTLCTTLLPNPSQATVVPSGNKENIVLETLDETTEENVILPQESFYQFSQVTTQTAPEKGDKSTPSELRPLETRLQTESSTSENDLQVPPLIFTKNTLRYAQKTEETATNPTKYQLDMTQEDSGPDIPPPLHLGQNNSKYLPSSASEIEAAPAPIMGTSTKLTPVESQFADQTGSITEESHALFAADGNTRAPNWAKKAPREPDEPTKTPLATFAQKPAVSHPFGERIEPAPSPAQQPSPSEQVKPPTPLFRAHKNDRTPTTEQVALGPHQKPIEPQPNAPQATPTHLAQVTPPPAEVTRPIGYRPPMQKAPETSDIPSQSQEHFSQITSPLETAPGSDLPKKKQIEKDRIEQSPAAIEAAPKTHTISPPAYETPSAPFVSDKGLPVPPAEEDEVLRPLEISPPHTTASHKLDTTPPHIPKTDLPARIMMQVMEAARQLPDRPVEITLSPEELGKVRMSLHVTEAGAMTITLAAERGDTLDLMRRNVEGLMQKFQELGYESCEFSFQSFHHQDQQGQPTKPKQHLNDESQPQDGVTIPSSRPSHDPALISLSAVAGIDIRL